MLLGPKALVLCALVPVYGSCTWPDLNFHPIWIQWGLGSYGYIHWYTHGYIDGYTHGYINRYRIDIPIAFSMYTSMYIY